MGYQKPENEVIAGPVRLSYVNLLEPRAAKGNTKLQYSCKILIPKTDQDVLKAIGAARDEARKRGVTEGKKPFKDFDTARLASMTLRTEDGDDPKFADQPECKGMVMINAKSPADKPPGIMNEKGVRITKDSSQCTEIYSGMWALVHLQLFAFDNMTQGISCALINVKKVKDDEPLGGGKRASAEDVFGAEGSPFESAPASAAGLI